MNEPLNFGIVGCGAIAQRHSNLIARFGKLRAACDIVEERAAALADQHQALAFRDIDEMLSSGLPLDVVVICTPNGLHAMHSIKALQQGYHVLCEKPMALTVPDCAAMIREAGRAGKKLFIVKQNRFNPPVMAVRQLIDEDRLGTIYSVQLNCFWNREADYYKNSWRGTRDLDGGTLFTQFSHFVDLLHWFIGDLASVDAIAGNFKHHGLIDFEDTGAVILKFLSGTIGTINYTVNAFGKNMEGSLTLFAEKGTVKIGGQYLNELEYQSLAGGPVAGLPPGNPPNNYGLYMGSMSNHDKVYENLVSVLNGEGLIATGGMEGLKTVEMIEMIYRQAGKRVDE